MRERQVGRAGQSVRLEPAQLDEIGPRARVAAATGSPGEAEDDAAVVRLEPEAEEVDRLDFERGLLADLATQCVDWMLVLVQEAAGEIPAAGARIERAP